MQIPARKIRPSYVKAKQPEMNLDGGFRLMMETTDDGERIAREARAAQEREEQARNTQLPLL